MSVAISRLSLDATGIPLEHCVCMCVCVCMHAKYRSYKDVLSYIKTKVSSCPSSKHDNNLQYEHPLSKRFQSRQEENMQNTHARRHSTA
jgi:hypothetical protein